MKDDVLDVVRCRAAFHLSLAQIGIRNARRCRAEMNKPGVSSEAWVAHRDAVLDGIARFKANRPYWHKYRRAIQWVEARA